MVLRMVAWLLAYSTWVQAQQVSDAHPSLLFSHTDLSKLRERVERPPYSDWWSTVRTRAQNGLPADAPERTKARLAKSLAFVYLMTADETWAQQALAVMRETRFPPRGGDMGQPHNEGELVAHYALAYDMIQAYAAANDTVALREIRTILAEEATRIEEGIVVAQINLGLTKLNIRLHETPHLDNWHIRAYAGLGIAALALRDHPDAPAWSQRARDLVVRSLNLQIDPQSGAYAEGPFYARYSADVYLPYGIALRRVEGRDLFAETPVHAMHQWSFNLRLPNGRRPNIDDGHLDDFYGHYLASIAENGGAFRWDWEHNTNGLYVRQFSEMDAIALFDDGVAATAPTGEPTVFMPSGGDAVFRSDWTEDATYLLLRGENGRPRSSGAAHEHPDETSFLLYAAKEMLALDAGYIDFTHHAKVNRAGNHNLVLVDGAGPPLRTAQGELIGAGNDAFIEGTFISENGDYAEVHTSYAGVDFRRRMLFVDKQYFLVADHLHSDIERAYEWRLHGNGGGTSGGTYARENGLARWTRSRGELLVFLPNRPGRSFAEIDTLHSFEAGQEQTHTTLRVQQRGANDHYLAVLYPRAIDAPTPTFTALSVSSGEGVRIAVDGRDDIAWTKHDSAETTAVAHLRSDGSFGWLSPSEPLGDELRFVVHDATYLSRTDATGANVDYFTSSRAADVSLSIAPERIAGFVRGPDEGYTLRFPIEREVRVGQATFNGQLLETRQDSGSVYLQLAGEGDIDLVLVAGESAAPQPLLLRGADLVGTFGPFLAQNGRERLFITYQNGLSGHIPERAAQNRADTICRLYGRAEAIDWLAMPSLTFSEPTLTQVTDTGLQIRNGRGQLEVNSRGRVLGPNKYFSITCSADSYTAGKRTARRLVNSPALETAYPNPFNSEVTIRFVLDASSAGEVALYNAAGQRVRTLATGLLHSGVHRLVWDGRDADGRPAATGIYLVSLRTETQHTSQKITLIR